MGTQTPSPAPERPPAIDPPWKASPPLTKATRPLDPPKREVHVPETPPPPPQRESSQSPGRHSPKLTPDSPVETKETLKASPTKARDPVRPKWEELPPKVRTIPKPRKPAPPPLETPILARHLIGTREHIAKLPSVGESPVAAADVAQAMPKLPQSPVINKQVARAAALARLQQTSPGIMRSRSRSASRSTPYFSGGNAAS